mmetsp:Transcript_15096/g.28404  ORF Transcript_15096/g.28404 Transcript_15096/m.28404 type:complete len:209 (-) Transcript_15096:304-930(-)|eukprot:CAMPEP_0176495770 /NCGR_PEP_ID=MMETSP0200_2-20121128/10841_1 /TAXON_ID=947934 /ORGANISM="Chaetoceros sp., Strain GSL56" /LENGTH=208 /DNA_ID=CAMNT_0017893685 /DNA_START=22 /DNA_END=648 /DNA_ORIENTATION=-
MKKPSRIVFIISLIQLYNTSTSLALCSNSQNRKTSSSTSTSTSTSNCSSRNAFLKKHLLTSATAAAGTLLMRPSLSNAAAIEKTDGEAAAATSILRSDKCAFGEGDGCSTLAGDNEFIQELQRRSREKKETAQKEYLSAYQMKNYPDFFASLSPPKYMVRKGDGTFELFDDAQLAELKKANRIKLEKPTAMGGKVQDYTQKPILVLID